MLGAQEPLLGSIQEVLRMVTCVPVVPLSESAGLVRLIDKRGVAPEWSFSIFPAYLLQLLYAPLHQQWLPILEEQTLQSLAQ